jgi:predicted transcriptional regulator
LKIKLTRLPGKGGAKRAVLDTLADSWYLRGLNITDMAELTAMSEKHVGLVLDDLVDEGLVEVKTKLGKWGYVITEKTKELLDADHNAV